MPYTTEHWRLKGSWFSYQGHKIFYLTEGGGEPLVLLHGFPTSSWDWHKLWDDLKIKYHVIALDFIGFGFSDKPRRYPYAMMDQADLVEQLLAHLHVTRYHLLTHDVGDTVAQELLARQLDRKTNAIQSCCMLNGGLFPETHHATRAQKMLLGPFGFIISRLLTYDRFAESFSILFPTNTSPSDEEMKDLYSLICFNGGDRIAHRLIRYILERRQHRERWVAALLKTNCPLRLIDGLADPVSGAPMVVRYRELIPNPDVLELTGCGHYPQMEMPEIVLNGYLEFRKNA